MASNDILTESDPLLQHVPQDSELKSTLGSVASDDCEISVLENTGKCPEPSLCLQVPSYVYINLKSIISTKYVSLRGDVGLGLKNLFKPVTIYLLYSQRHSVINHCDRRITLLSDIEIFFLCLMYLITLLCILNDSK